MAKYVPQGVVMPLQRDINWANKKGFTRLHLAVKSQKAGTVENLLACNADCSMPDHLSRTALRIAVESGCAKIVKLFCDAGVDLDAYAHRGRWNEPLFICAVSSVHMDVARVLIEYGMDISVRYRGESSLHISSRSDTELEMLQLLVDHGVDVNVRTDAGDTALGLAAWNDNLAGMKLLLSKGADVGAKDRRGNTPLHFSTRNGYPDMMEVLLQNGACMHASNLDGLSVLHCAASAVYTSMATLLCYGVDIEARDGGRKTAFLVAVEQRNEKVVQMLMNAGADVTVCDMDGNTAIHYAANDGDALLIRVVLRSGMLMPPANRYDKTPLQLAIAAEGPVVRLFEKRGWWVNHQECEEVIRESLRND
jgi:ankyrin repeat protein